MADKLADPKAKSLNAAAIPLCQVLPKWTLDNGKELSQFKELEEQAGLTVYFPFQSL